LCTKNTKDVEKDESLYTTLLNGSKLKVVNIGKDCKTEKFYVNEQAKDFSIVDKKASPLSIMKAFEEWLSENT
jgi:hypothetical protein